MKWWWLNIWFWLMWSFFVCLPSGRQSDRQPGHQTGQQGDWSQGKLPLEPREEQLRGEKEKHDKARRVSAPESLILQVTHSHVRPVQLSRAMEKAVIFTSLFEATPFSSGLYGLNICLYIKMKVLLTRKNAALAIKQMFGIRVKKIFVERWSFSFALRKKQPTLMSCKPLHLWSGKNSLWFNGVILQHQQCRRCAKPIWERGGTKRLIVLIFASHMHDAAGRKTPQCEAM